MNMNIWGPVHYAVAGDLVICSGVCGRRQARQKGACRLPKTAAAMALLAALLSGCATRSDFTAISGKNINLTSIRIDKAHAKGKAQGEDCEHVVIVFPTSGPPSLSEALDRALESKQGNLMLDAVVKHNWFYIPYIYGQECWKAEGVVYDTNE